MIFKRMRFILSGLIVALAAACTATPGGGSNGGGSASSSGGLVLGPGVYIATNGSDTNSGTTSAAPLKTIQTALSNAAANGLTNIYVAQGIYTPGNGLNPGASGVFITNSGINLFGGFSGDFSGVTGLSILYGQMSLNHIISVSNVSNIIIKGFVMTGGQALGSAPDSEGGGIALFKTVSSFITNCIVSNNYADLAGGGIYIENSSYNLISCTIISNHSYYGGGMQLWYSLSNTLNCIIIGNIGDIQGGGLDFDASTSNKISGFISGNSAVKGGGLYLSSSVLLDINGIFSNNTATNGGGIYIQSSCDQTVIKGSIMNNSAGAGNGFGGGLFVQANNTLITNAVISGNSAFLGGGLYIDLGVNNMRIFADISHNYASALGGGLMSILTTNLYIDSGINSNSANEGGAVYMNEGYNDTLKGVMSGNTAFQMAGAVEIYRTLNTVIDADMINNTCVTDFGAALYTRLSTNLHIINSIITNNLASSTNSVIMLGDNVGSFMISNCTIGCVANINASYAIFEFVMNTTGQTIVDNMFITNAMNFLYEDSYGTHYVSSDDSWTNINDTNYTGAGVAYGNKVTNL